MALHVATTLLLALFVGFSRQQNSALERACNPPYTPVGGECLFINPLVTGSWEDMRAYCQSAGGDLVNVFTAQFYADIVYFIQAQEWPRANYWVGGTDEGHEGVWVWLDGTLMRMGTPLWATGGCLNSQRPDGGTGENCAVMSDIYHLFINDLDCTSTAVHPICQAAT